MLCELIIIQRSELLCWAHELVRIRISKAFFNKLFNAHIEGRNLFQTFYNLEPRCI